MNKKKFLITAITLIFILSACTPAAPTAAPAADTAAPIVAPVKKEAAPTVAKEQSAATVPPVVEKKLKIGFTLPTLQFPFYVRMHDTFLAEAQKRGWDVVYVDGNLDSLTQVNASLDLLTKDVDALVMATWWLDAMVDVFDTAAKQNVPVFLMDSTVEQVPSGSKIVSASGTDNFDAGHVGGVWMAKRLTAEGKKSLNLILVTMNSDTAVKRCDGFVAGLKDSGIEVNVLNKYEGDTRANGMRTMEDALVTYPQGKIDLVFGYSAQSSLGAEDAILAANRKEIQVIGFDGEDDEIKLIDAGSNYIGTVVQYPDKMATLTAELIEKSVINGEKIDIDQKIPAGVYEGKK